MTAAEKRGDTLAPSKTATESARTGNKESITQKSARLVGQQTAMSPFGTRARQPYGAPREPGRHEAIESLSDEEFEERIAHRRPGIKHRIPPARKGRGAAVLGAMSLFGKAAQAFYETDPEHVASAVEYGGAALKATGFGTRRNRAEPSGRSNAPVSGAREIPGRPSFMQSMTRGTPRQMEQLRPTTRVGQERPFRQAPYKGQPGKTPDEVGEALQQKTREGVDVPLEERAPEDLIRRLQELDAEEQAENEAAESGEEDTSPLPPMYRQKPFQVDIGAPSRAQERLQITQALKKQRTGPKSARQSKQMSSAAAADARPRTREGLQAMDQRQLRQEAKRGGVVGRRASEVLSQKETTGEGLERTRAKTSSSRSGLRARGGEELPPTHTRPGGGLRAVAKKLSERSERNRQLFEESRTVGRKKERNREIKERLDQSLPDRPRMPAEKAALMERTRGQETRPSRSGVLSANDRRIDQEKSKVLAAGNELVRPKPSVGKKFLAARERFAERVNKRLDESPVGRAVDRLDEAIDRREAQDTSSAASVKRLEKQSEKAQKAADKKRKQEGKERVAADRRRGDPNQTPEQRAKRKAAFQAAQATTPSKNRLVRDTDEEQRPRAQGGRPVETQRQRRERFQAGQRQTAQAAARATGQGTAVSPFGSRRSEQLESRTRARGKTIEGARRAQPWKELRRERSAQARDERELGTLRQDEASRRPPTVGQESAERGAPPSEAQSPLREVLDQPTSEAQAQGTPVERVSDALSQMDEQEMEVRLRELEEKLAKVLSPDEAAKTETELQLLEAILKFGREASVR